MRLGERERFKGEKFVDLVDISEVSPALFITGAIFILLVGSFLSLGAVRFFQLRKQQGFMYIGLAVVSFIVLILVMNRWFV
jgi:hypothetical protein